MGVQLTSLALFNHWMSGHYLYASAAAIELTLLHNFIWHIHYTWRDRRDKSTWWRQLIRFHLSNGLVSMAGNLILMRLLVHQAHLPVIASNVIAIACCSIANFCLSNAWAFAGTHKSDTLPVRRAAYVPPLALTLLFLLVAGAAAQGQTQALPENPAPHTQDLGTDCAYENIFVGTAVSAGGNTIRPSFTGGITFGQYFARTLGEGLNASPQFELGVVGPLPGGYPLDGLASVNFMFANKIPHRGLYPSFTGGYTRMFATGNALNFGLGIDFGKDEARRLIRIELRDYYLFTGPRQHVIGLRIGFGKFIAD